MKKTPLFLIATLLSGWGFCQTIGPEILSSGGAQFSTTDIQLTWTLGEPLITTYSTDQLQLSQGFQQGNLSITSRAANIGKVAIRLYPNPVVDLLLFEWPESPRAIELRLFNASGKLVLERSYSELALPNSIDFSPFPAGSYFLYLHSQDYRQFNSFQIIKHKQ